MAHLRRLARPFALAAMTASLAGAALAQDSGVIDAAALNAHVRALADDRFEGRGPASSTEPAVLDWIANAFAEAGLEPAGADGGWLQPVPLSSTQQDGPATVSVSGSGWTLPLERGGQILLASDRPQTRISIQDAPLVFVGYGVSAPERDWDDFKGVDLTGKVMVVLVNDPDFEAPQDHPTAGLFDGQAMTFYGRWVYKFDEAARRGAAGVLIVHETAGAGYGWSVLENSSTAPDFDIVRADPMRERVAGQGWIQRDVAVDLFRRAGLDFEALKQTAMTRDFRPVPLDGVTLSADFGQTVRQVMTHNVAGQVRGVVRPEETVIYGAHWDAYGRATPNAAGDDIYNGAVDNATGVAALIELGRLFASGPAPERSVMVVAWAAEEAGLLGAYHYAADPLTPLETTVANINLDSLLPGPVQHEVMLIGAGKSDLEDRLATLVAREGRALIPDPAPQAGGFYRSDHFPLALRGVPALFAAAGFTGANEASRAYVAERYHQPTDDWNDSWTMDGAAADIQLLFEVGRDLANSADWPRWRAGSEFEAVRESSAAARR
jgi:Zn-dependent M28 family amino/carboxypeptidase